MIYGFEHMSLPTCGLRYAALEMRTSFMFIGLFGCCLLALVQLDRQPEGSFGLEVFGGQRQFPGGHNCSKVNFRFATELARHKRSELVSFRSRAHVAAYWSALASHYSLLLTPSRSLCNPHIGTEVRLKTVAKTSFSCLGALHVPH